MKADIHVSYIVGDNSAEIDDRIHIDGDCFTYASDMCKSLTVQEAEELCLALFNALEDGRNKNG